VAHSSILPLADADGHDRTRVGGKAWGLGRLIAAGLPVPDGFVVTGDAYTRAAAPSLSRLGRLVGPPDARAVELLASAAATLRATPLVDDLAAALAVCAHALAPSLVVRSSASIEDALDAAAPGLLLSLRGVTPGEALTEAVRRVWASALTPAVATYLAARDLGYADLAVAVIVQAEVTPAQARGTLYTRVPDPAGGAVMLIEVRPRAGAVTWAEMARSGEVRKLSARFRRTRLLPTLSQQLAPLGTAAEQALGEPATLWGADVEWVKDDERVWLVQARCQGRVEGFVGLIEAAAPPVGRAIADELVWRRDALHNPEPLSPAQIGLVEQVDRLRLGTARMRVVDGCLYVADAPVVQGAVTTISPIDLGREFTDALAPAMERALAVTEHDRSLATALHAFDEVYRVYAGKLTPALAEARRMLPDLLGSVLPDEDAEALVHRLLGLRNPTRLESILEAVAHGDAARAELVRVAGPMAPAWDVATPTYGERPDILDAAVAAAGRRANARDAAHRAAERAEAETRARINPVAHGLYDRALAIVRTAAEVAELDDRTFARAQWAVRRALLELGDAWGLLPDDIFYLPLPEVADHARRAQPIDAAAAGPRAAAARARLDRQRQRLMPLTLVGDHPVPAAPRARDTNRWVGRGCGGRTQGVVVLAARIATALPAGTILVAQTVTPATTFLLQQAAGLVLEHGGLLDHGPALARELGIPAIVACRGAAGALANGDTVWLDGAAGTVIRLARAP
jgi:pyruvate,water dikinase